MIIPSIFLPITLELFDVHFQRFFFDFTKEPDFLKYYLTRIEIGKVGYRYIIELEGQDSSTTPVPKRVINEIDALLIYDNKIEIRSSTLEPLSVFYEDWSWADAFIDEFYIMVNSKWNIWPSFPNVEEIVDIFDKVSNSAQIQFSRDFKDKYLLSSFPPIISSDNDKGNDAVEKNPAPLPGADAERKKRLSEIYDQLIYQGLPPIEAVDEVTSTAQYQKRGPTLNTRERAEIIKKIKDSHLNWSYSRVAMEVSKELGEYISRRCRAELLSSHGLEVGACRSSVVNKFHW